MQDAILQTPFRRQTNLKFIIHIHYKTKRVRACKSRFFTILCTVKKLVPFSCTIWVFPKTPFDCCVEQWNHFFSAQLVAVQKRSSFFLLRKVCKLRKVRKIFLKTTIFKTSNLRWLFHSKKAVAQLFPAKSASPCFFYFLLEKGYVFGKVQKSQKVSLSLNLEEKQLRFWGMSIL